MLAIRAPAAVDATACDANLLTMQTTQRVIPSDPQNLLTERSKNNIWEEIATLNGNLIP